MAHAAPTKQGQAQSRGVAVEGLGFARLLALLALALSSCSSILTIACLLPLLWLVVQRSSAVACAYGLDY